MKLRRVALVVIDQCYSHAEFKHLSGTTSAARRPESPSTSPSLQTPMPRVKSARALQNSPFAALPDALLVELKGTDVNAIGSEAA